MRKTFDDFIKLACRTYNLDFNEAWNFIFTKLSLYNLTPLSITCYINWADNDCLLQKEIAIWLGISQQAVAYHLNKIRQVWPHLFNFGVKTPPIKYMPRLPEDYEQSTKSEVNIKRKF